MTITDSIKAMPTIADALLKYFCYDHENRVWRADISLDDEEFKSLKSREAIDRAAVLAMLEGYAAKLRGPIGDGGKGQETPQHEEQVYWVREVREQVADELVGSQVSNRKGE